MTKKELAALAEKYLAGKATPEEKQLLNEWYNNFDDDLAITANESEPGHNAAQRMRSRLESFLAEQNRDTKSTSAKGRWTSRIAVASFILAGMIATFFIWKNAGSHTNEIASVGEMGGGVQQKEEKEDGIRSSQELEFEITKDLTLGYIPLNRLITATEQAHIARRNGAQNRLGALSWTERGPNTDIIGIGNGNTRGTQPPSDAVTSGRMRSIWVDLTSATTVWAGGVDGGLWKSTNITSTDASEWSLVSDFFSNLAVTGICQDPANTDVMYFGTGEKTFNVDAVRGGGVWKSIDHGVTWNLLTNTTGFFNVSKVLCDAAGNVYVSTIGANGIQRSTDGGANWTNITPTGLTSFVTEMKISSTGRLHIVCGYQNNGISGYRYTDAPSTVDPTTWTSPATTFPTEWNSELAVGGTGTTLYALPSNASDLTPTIYKSIDGGANWAATPTSPPGTGAEPTINAGQGWYDLAIGVDPTNDDVVIAGGLNFFRSTDGGATWAQLTRWVGVALNYVHADHHTVVWNSGGQVLLGTDGGIFYSNDNGASFTDRNDGLRLKQFYSCAIHPTLTNQFLAGAQDNGVHQLNSPGLGGSTEVFGGDGGFVHIDQDEPIFQLGATTQSNYRRSVNSGTTFASFSLGGIGQFINPTDFDDINNKLYCSAAAGQYIRWEDAVTGASFAGVTVAAFNAASTRAITVSPYTPNRVFFGTFGGRIVRVDNAHTNTPTATNITQAGMSASNVSSIAVGTNDNNLLATFSNYGAIHIWVTTNGSTWTNITGTGLPDIPVRWAMFYPEDNTKALLATEMGIYETDLINGASTVWVQNSTFPVARTNMLQYRKSDGTVLAATHGRGLWTAPIPFAAPYIRFAAPHTTQPEMTSATTGCRNYTDYVVNMNIDMAPTGDANVTLNVAGGGTATQGVDFDFTTNGNFAAPSNVLTFAGGATTPQPITIRIYNDANTESTESFTLNYSVGGGTNALAAPSSPAYIFMITDNDLGPNTSVTATVGTNNTNVNQPFRGQFSDSKTRMVYLASELTAAGFTAGLVTSIGLNVTSKLSSAPYQNLTIKMKNSSTTTLLATSGFEKSITQVFGPVSYSTVAGQNTFNLTTPFQWDGTSNIIVEMCYDNVTGTASDNVAGTSALPRCDFERVDGASGCDLNVATVQFAGGGARPVMTFTIGSVVEATATNSRSEHVGDNGTYYFYNAGNIINTLSNASASLGCVTSSVFEAGNTWQPFFGGFRSQKVVEITPTTNPGASYTVGIYFTAAELSTYSGTPGTLRLAKTTAATMAAANGSNSVIAPSTSFTAFGSGYVFTGTFTGFSKFFLIDPTSTLPVTLLTFNGRLENKTIPLTWNTSQELNSSHFEVEKSTNGTDFRFIGKVTAAGSSITQREYGFVDRQVMEYNYYRLKMVDIDRRFTYSNTILVKDPGVAQNVWVLNNPFTTSIDIRMARVPRQPVRLELVNMAGATLYSKEFGPSDQLRLDVSGTVINTGTYLLRARVDDKWYVNKVVKR